MYSSQIKTLLFTSEKQYNFTLSLVDNVKCNSILSCICNKHFVFTVRKVELSYYSMLWYVLLQRIDES